jgi:LysM repeat protein
MSNRSKILALLLFLAPFLAQQGLAQQGPAAPSRIVYPNEVAAAVNALRTGQGLEPYQNDSGLAAYAQNHSEYQASIDSSTHVHKDGSTASGRGLLENIASGSPDSLTAEAIVYQIWTDGLHRNPMVGYTSGSLGVGVAQSSSTVYVTLIVRPGGQQANPPENSPAAGATSGAGASEPQESENQSSSPIPPTPFQTSTPRADGSIEHVVGPGESLWSIAIAYGVHIVDLRDLNRLAADSNTIYEGQKLLVLPAGAATPGAAQGSAATASLSTEEPAGAPATGQPAGGAPAKPEAASSPEPPPASSSEKVAASSPTGVPEGVETEAPAELAAASSALPTSGGGLSLGQALSLAVILVCSALAAGILISGFRKKPGM